MNPKEFRIGNIIEYDYPTDGWDQLILKPIDIDNDLYDDEIFRPCKLTDEWLKKFGFSEFDRTEESYEWGWEKDGFEIWDLQWEGTEEEGYVFEQGNHSLTLKYVHQLQNLFFVLMGKELEVEN